MVSKKNTRILGNSLHHDVKRVLWLLAFRRLLIVICLFLYKLWITFLLLFLGALNENVKGIDESRRSLLCTRTHDAWDYLNSCDALPEAKQVCAWCTIRHGVLLSNNELKIWTLKTGVTVYITRPACSRWFTIAYSVLVRTWKFQNKFETTRSNSAHNLKANADFFLLLVGDVLWTWAIDIFVEEEQAQHTVQAGMLHLLCSATSQRVDSSIKQESPCVLLRLDDSLVGWMGEVIVSKRMNFLKICDHQPENFLWSSWSIRPRRVHHFLTILFWNSFDLDQE